MNIEHPLLNHALLHVLDLNCRNQEGVKRGLRGGGMYLYIIYKNSNLNIWHPCTLLWYCNDMGEGRPRGSMHFLKKNLYIKNPFPAPSQFINDNFLRLKIYCPLKHMPFNVNLRVFWSTPYYSKCKYAIYSFKFGAGMKIIWASNCHLYSGNFVREAAKKVFFSGPATKAFTPPPSQLSGSRNFFFVLK